VRFILGHPAFKVWWKAMHEIFYSFSNGKKIQDRLTFVKVTAEMSGTFLWFTVYVLKSRDVGVFKKVTRAKRLKFNLKIMDVGNLISLTINVYKFADMWHNFLILT